MPTLSLRGPFFGHDYALPTRPPKSEGNPHARKFNDAESVELDAMGPDDLRRLLRQAIEAHMDSRELEVMLDTEESERMVLNVFPTVMYNSSREQEKISMLKQQGYSISSTAPSPTQGPNLCC